MNDRKYLNNEWKFSEDAETDATVSVRIPHTCKEFPYHYFNESKCQMRCKYERPLFILDEWKGKTLLLTFEGAAHNAEVFINDEPVYEHRCGYTAFTIDITDHVEYGKSNRIRVILDTRESQSIRISWPTAASIGTCTWMSKKRCTFRTCMCAPIFQAAGRRPSVG